MRKFLEPEEAIWIIAFNVFYFIPFLVINRAGLYFGLPDDRRIGFVELVACMVSALAIKVWIERFWPARAYWKSD